MSYLAMPRTDAQVPAVVLASTVRGVDEDLRAIADEFAANW
jgi:dienelactone hydrolase